MWNRIELLTQSLSFTIPNFVRLHSKTFCIKSSLALELGLVILLYWPDLSTCVLIKNKFDNKNITEITSTSVSGIFQGAQKLTDLITQNINRKKRVLFMGHSKNM
jgi:hypothetical protein